MRQLSPRESAILALFDEGLELKEIAGRLELSFHTVCTYAKRICQKTPELTADGDVVGPCYSLRRAAWLRRQAGLASSVAGSQSSRRSSA